LLFIILLAQELLHDVTSTVNIREMFFSFGTLTFWILATFEKGSCA